MSFTSTVVEKSQFILAQDFNSGAEGSGDSSSIVGAIQGFTNDAVAIGGAAIGLAFIISVIWVGVSMAKGGSLQSAFTGVAIIFVVAILLGLGTRAIGWFIGMGSSVGA